MKAIWQDASSFARDAKDRTPRTWRLNPGRISIVVTRDIFLEKDVWALRCDSLYTYTSLGKISADEAKTEAIKLVREQLQEALNDLGES